MLIQYRLLFVRRETRETEEWRGSREIKEWRWVGKKLSGSYQDFLKTVHGMATMDTKKYI